MITANPFLATKPVDHIMAHKETVLPVDNEGFREDAKKLFSLETRRLRELVQELGKRGKLFSTAVVMKISNTEALDGKRLRYTTLALTHRLLGRHADPKAFVKELVELGCKEEEVNAFVSEVSNLKSPETVAANCRFLLDVIHYGARVLRHLGSVGVQFNYTLLETPKGPLENQPLFPLVHIEIESHKVQGESDSIEFDVDPSDFESLVLELQQSLAHLRAESKVLKGSLGEKFTGLVEE